MEKNVFSGDSAMVICAHPDDAEFGVGGTVAAMTTTGKKVTYVVCTMGEKGTSDRNMAPERLAEIRKEEQLRAAEVLGVEKVVFLGYPDQALEDTAQFRKQIVSILRKFKPHVVLTSDPHRRYIWHRDHRIVGQVVLDAVYPYARDHLAYPDLIEKGLEPHKVKEIYFWGAEQINHHWDITETFHKKLAALKCHQSQVNALDIKNLESRLKNRSREMAEGQPFELAEAFYRVIAP